MLRRSFLIYNNKNAGLTLVEALVAIAIFGLFAILVNSILFNILRGAAKQEARTEVRQNGDFAMRILEQRMRNALRVTIPGTCATPPYPVNAVQLLSDEFVYTNIFMENDGSIWRLALQEVDPSTGVAGAIEYITSELVTGADANALQFSCSSFGDSELLSAELTLEHIHNIRNPSDPSSQAEMKFISTVYVRN